MNYRHIFHAGNFADVFKHIVLTILLEHLCGKDKAFSYIDTHAGIGLYDLTRNETARSPEYQQGIIKLMDSAPQLAEIKNYLAIIQSYQVENILRFYPGSPLISNHFLRPQDQMILNEFHPQDYLTLKAAMKKIINSHCHQRDAYEFLPAILPPVTKRGLILIDPPYEKESDYLQIIEVMEKCIKRFANGIYMIWYPIVSHQHENFIKNFNSRIQVPALYSELTLTKIGRTRQGLIGCGVIILNPRAIARDFM